MTKKTYLCDRFFESNQNFTTEHVRNVKNSRFFYAYSRFYHIFPGFKVKWQL